MQRSDAIAAAALVVALIAFFYKPAAQPVAPPAPAPVTHIGHLYARAARRRRLQAHAEGPRPDPRCAEGD